MKRKNNIFWFVVSFSIKSRLTVPRVHVYLSSRALGYTCTHDRTLNALTECTRTEEYSNSLFSETKLRTEKYYSFFSLYFCSQNSFLVFFTHVTGDTVIFIPVISFVQRHIQSVTETYIQVYNWRQSDTCQHKTHNSRRIWQYILLYFHANGKFHYSN